MDPAQTPPGIPDVFFPEDFVAHLASRFGLSPAVAEERLGELLVHYHAVRQRRREEREQAARGRALGTGGLVEVWEPA